MTDLNEQSNKQADDTNSKDAQLDANHTEQEQAIAEQERAYLTKVKQAMIDDDLFEPLTHEEMREIMNEARAKKQAVPETNRKERVALPRRYRLFAVVLAVFMVIQAVALLATTFSVPVVDFLITSHQLSNDPVISEDKEAIVIVETGSGRGTGFIASRDGYIITNAHVVDGEKTVTIGLADQSLLTGTVIESLPAVDLALIKVDQTFTMVLPLSLTVPVLNQTVHFIGNPLRFNRIANAGTFIEANGHSALATPVYYLDAPVYRGNSGSPVINAQGEVEGIVYATRNDQTHGKIGLVIPAAVAWEAFRTYLPPVSD